MQPEKERILAKFAEGSEKTITCHEGWMNLIIDLDTEISKLAPDYKITKIREKYGLLNFYVTNVPEDIYVEVYDLIADAEDKSAHICEMCGLEGLEGILDEWWTVRCENCSPPGWKSWESIKTKYGLSDW